MREKQEHYDVGVIVGRFQVATLHDGHKQLIEHVISNHDRVIIFLGLSPARVTQTNPLDFESRKQMLLSEYPEVNVLYIRDVNDDHIWSRDLDSQISNLVGPRSTVVLYGSRESFIDHYHGKHDCRVMEQTSFESGSEIRKKIGRKVRSNEAFREGVIWAAYNQWPRAIPTVDIAIWNEEATDLLLARKPDESCYRFVGGFVQSDGNFEMNARREVAEETHIECSEMTYLGSTIVDDWRYRRELDKIVTLFYETKHIFGKPCPDDDICELKWFPTKELRKIDVVETHHNLVEMLKGKYSDRFPKW